MKISEILSQAQAEGRSTISVEFFPPKTAEGEVSLWQTVQELDEFKLDFASVTYGAGGSTQEKSVAISQQVLQKSGLETISHLTCVGATASEIDLVVDRFVEAGISNLLALRGDPIAGPGTAWITTPGGYTYASELVQALAKRGDLCIGVAAFPNGHPESNSLLDDAKVLALKQSFGAEFAMTNLFFEAEHFYHLKELAAVAGFDRPLIAGLMPVTNFSQVERFTTLSGAKLPQVWLERFTRVSNDTEAVRALGVELVYELASELLSTGVDGIHLYTLNRHNSTEQVFARLRADGWPV